MTEGDENHEKALNYLVQSQQCGLAAYLTEEMNKYPKGSPERALLKSIRFGIDYGKPDSTINIHTDYSPEEMIARFKAMLKLLDAWRNNMEITVELTEEQCYALLKLLDACGPLRASEIIQFQSTAARARYGAGQAILSELKKLYPIDYIMDKIASLSEV